MDGGDLVAIFLVERFALGRMDGGLVLTYAFKHTWKPEANGNADLSLYMLFGQRI